MDMLTNVGMKRYLMIALTNMGQVANSTSGAQTWMEMGGQT